MSVASVRDVRPVLCNVKIVADKRDGVFLTATDAEIGIRIRVDADVSKDGEALLPPKQFRQILESVKDGRLTLESTETGIVVTREYGGNEHWELDSQSPDEFPDVADFTETAYHEIPAKALSKIIQRTLFATDNENPQYALGGVCFESNGKNITAVATDGYRLATQDASGICVNDHEFEPAILPVNVLKVLAKILKEKSVSDAGVKMAVNAVADNARRTSGRAHFQCGGVTIFSRLLEGRFPKWRTIVPKTDDRLHAGVRCKSLRTALDQMVTTKLEPGVLFAFQRGSLTLSSRAKESGQSKTTIPVVCNDTTEFIVDVTLIRDYLRTLDAETVIDIHMSFDNDPLMFEIGDSNYKYVVMPMTKPAVKVNAEPEADTGIEVVGQASPMQISTEEEPMSEMDEPLDSDDDTDLQTRFFQLQMENDQLQARAEHYKVLLDRAMLVIERMKSDQRVCV